MVRRYDVLTNFFKGNKHSLVTNPLKQKLGDNSFGLDLGSWDHAKYAEKLHQSKYRQSAGFDGKTNHNQQQRCACPCQHKEPPKQPKCIEFDLKESSYMNTLIDTIVSIAKNSLNKMFDKSFDEIMGLLFDLAYEIKSNETKMARMYNEFSSKIDQIVQTPLSRNSNSYKYQKMFEPPKWGAEKPNFQKSFEKFCISGNNLKTEKMKKKTKRSKTNLVPFSSKADSEKVKSRRSKQDFGDIANGTIERNKSYQKDKKISDNRKHIIINNDNTLKKTDSKKSQLINTPSIKSKLEELKIDSGDLSNNTESNNVSAIVHNYIFKEGADDHSKKESLEELTTSTVNETKMDPLKRSEYKGTQDKLSYKDIHESFTEFINRADPDNVERRLSAESFGELRKSKQLSRHSLSFANGLQKEIQKSFNLDNNKSRLIEEPFGEIRKSKRLSNHSLSFANGSQKEIQKSFNLDNNKSRSIEEPFGEIRKSKRLSNHSLSFANGSQKEIQKSFNLDSNKSRSIEEPFGEIRKSKRLSNHSLSFANGSQKEIQKSFNLDNNKSRSSEEPFGEIRKSKRLSAASLAVANVPQKETSQNLVPFSSKADSEKVKSRRSKEDFGDIANGTIERNKSYQKDNISSNRISINVTVKRSKVLSNTPNTREGFNDKIQTNDLELNKSKESYSQQQDTENKSTHSLTNDNECDQDKKGTDHVNWSSENSINRSYKGTSYQDIADSTYEDLTLRKSFSKSNSNINTKINPKIPNPRYNKENEDNILEQELNKNKDEKKKHMQRCIDECAAANRYDNSCDVKYVGNMRKGDSSVEELEETYDYENMSSQLYKDKDIYSNGTENDKNLTDQKCKRGKHIATDSKSNYYVGGCYDGECYSGYEINIGKQKKTNDNYTINGISKGFESNKNVDDTYDNVSNIYSDEENSWINLNRNKLSKSIANQKLPISTDVKRPTHNGLHINRCPTATEPLDAYVAPSTENVKTNSRSHKSDLVSTTIKRRKAGSDTVENKERYYLRQPIYNSIYSNQNESDRDSSKFPMHPLLCRDNPATKQESSNKKNHSKHYSEHVQPKEIHKMDNKPTFSKLNRSTDDSCPKKAKQMPNVRIMSLDQIESQIQNFKENSASEEEPPRPRRVLSKVRQYNYILKEAKAEARRWNQKHKQSI